MQRKYTPSGYLIGRPFADRFWGKVDKNGPNGCWLWLGGINENGHGFLSRGKNDPKGSTMAHRIAWEFTRGEIPAGLFILHCCDRSDCVNPAHLRTGTLSENQADRWQRRQNATFAERPKGVRRPAVDRICQNPECGRLFKISQHNLDRGRLGLYCCLKCKGKGLARPVEERFLEKVDKNGPVPPHRPELGPCWIWNGARLDYGHGQLNVDGVARLAHRISWELYRSAIPADLFVLHHCDRGECVNPDHLFLGNQSDNMADAAIKGRTAHFPADHPERMPRGEAHHATHLTEDDIRAMRRRHAAGETRKALAAEYGISASVCGDILQRRSWKHVE